MKKLLTISSVIAAFAAPALLMAQGSQFPTQGPRPMGPGHPDWKGQTIQTGTPSPGADVGGLNPADIVKPLSDEWRSYSANVRFQEYREDRYVAAVSLEAGGEVDLYYLVRAVSPGEYLIPATFVEDMYRPEFRAITGTPAARLKVVSPGP